MLCYSTMSTNDPSQPHTLPAPTPPAVAVIDASGLLTPKTAVFFLVLLLGGGGGAGAVSNAVSALGGQHDGAAAKETKESVDKLGLQVTSIATTLVDIRADMKIASNRADGTTAKLLELEARVQKLEDARRSVR